MHRVDVSWEDYRDKTISGMSRVVVEAKTESKAMLKATHIVAARKKHVVAVDYVL